MVIRQSRLAIPSNEEYSVPQLRMMLTEVDEILSLPSPRTPYPSPSFAVQSLNSSACRLPNDH